MAMATPLARMPAIHAVMTKGMSRCARRQKEQELRKGGAGKGESPDVALRS